MKPRNDGGAKVETKLSRLEPFADTSKLVRIVIEAQKGSRVKLKFDEGSGVFNAEKVLPPGLTFPFDFGFIPSTRAEDGDPLDALVLSESGLPPMIVVLAKVVKIMKCRQTEKGKIERNDRIVAIPVDAKSREPMQPAIKADRVLLEAISNFFAEYNKLQGKKFEVLRTEGAREALEAIRKSRTGARNRA